MENVTDRTSNPFGMRPACDRFVPGYGDANANFHVVGDHPGVHGGEVTGVPFTNEPGIRLQAALAEAGLLDSTGDEPDVRESFFSYLHMCVADGTPTQAEYDDMERFFDAELRAIAAHVLLPVGARATAHVLQNYTAQAWKTEIEMEALHGEEIRGSGFLVYPIKDPAEWDETHHDRLVDSLLELQSTDYRREADLGRFEAGNDPYLVR
ncbi:uracil-DNA glycosylase family protein [Halopelagius longus]|uniref:Uracil-DNA glycosylase n=1 Tax=Halopelagius longus TaxID=1236180 RepID=A0A1H1BWT0_9EURY|nr:uracil-DNA glycosylase family protein [Halopelagius longus]RDI70959.1 uracil-DNA glycosylase [Halopelagius longus]SDQ56369.1 uracil-DNA glycosylase, family 4 [Halopelagius longus]